MAIDAKLLSLFDLTGRHALVTGGSSGIGEAMAGALAAAGARVTLVARREDELQRASERLRKQGRDADWLACDLSGRHALRACAQEALGRWGRIDILVNAAGVNLRRGFMENRDEDWDKTLAINLTAPFLLTQCLAPVMRQAGWGRIINIASLQSLRAFPDSAPYGASKGGVMQLTRAIAEAWSRHGITCNALGPGFFPTPLTAPLFENPQRAQWAANQTMIGRNGTLEDLAGLTVFLASEASAYVTGQTIYIDGGFTAK